MRRQIAVGLLSLTFVIAAWADVVPPRDVGAELPTTTPSATPSPKIPSMQPLSGVCKDRCGDGDCQEIVCQAEGCPCEESSSSCPQDCP